MSLITGDPPGEVGTCCLVLHTHLPWIAHAGAWPVGEEWLHQAFTASWRRVAVVWCLGILAVFFLAATALFRRQTTLSAQAREEDLG